MTNKDNTRAIAYCAIICGVTIFYLGLSAWLSSIPVNNSSGGVYVAPDDGWDEIAVKYVVRQRLEPVLKDPSSLEIISVEKIDGLNGNPWSVQATYRAKNGFGGYSVETQIFP
jgi:hypothetical protein